MAGMTSKFGAPTLFVFVPVGMGVFVLVAALTAFLNSASQAEKQDSLAQRRQELVRKLEELKKQPASASQHFQEASPSN